MNVMSSPFPLIEPLGVTGLGLLGRLGFRWAVICDERPFVAARHDERG
jgi:hypothetical protein